MSGPMWMPSAAPTAARLLDWHPQPIPVFPALALVLMLIYGVGVERLHRAGNPWPIVRTSAFAAGLLTLILVTATGVGGYGMQLMSVHMVQHMVLSMLTPVLLLLGAPITLALRTLPGGRAGPRRVLLRLLHSRVARFLSSPLFSLPVFLVSLYGLYLTPAFDALMSNWWAHNLMLVHFLVVGLLFFWPIVGIDPTPRRSPHVLRMLELMVGVPFHAFFGIAVMMSNALIVHYFAHPPSAWGIAALSDQSAAGGIAWAFSEVPTGLVLIIVAASWARSDEREARRADRAADRDGDRRLAEYNAYLATLGRR